MSIRKISFGPCERWRRGAGPALGGAFRRVVLGVGMLVVVGTVLAQDPNERPKITMPGEQAQQSPLRFERDPFRGGGVRVPPAVGNGNESDSPIVRLEPSGRNEPPIYVNENLLRTAREVGSHSTGTPEWSNPRGFEKDVYTFARIIFPTGIDLLRGVKLGWWVDYPDADLNFSYRLQQMTSMKVDPDGRVLKLTDPTLRDYPLVLMEHPGYMRLRDAEVGNLRNYLLNGGVLLVIDFWSQREWDGFAAQMNRVLPGRTWTELSTEHPLFNCVFDVRRPMQELQVPTMQFWDRQHNPRDPSSPPLQWMYRGEGAEKMTVRALYDDKQRIMALAFHNSDITDGWEREGERDDYFRTFSEKISYPLGINIIFYLMTH